MNLNIQSNGISASKGHTIPSSQAWANSPLPAAGSIQKIIHCNINRQPKQCNRADFAHAWLYYKYESFIHVKRRYGYILCCGTVSPLSLDSAVCSRWTYGARRPYADGLRGRRPPRGRIPGPGRAPSGAPAGRPAQGLAGLPAPAALQRRLARPAQWRAGVVAKGRAAGLRRVMPPAATATLAASSWSAVGVDDDSCCFSGSRWSFPEGSIDAGVVRTISLMRTLLYVFKWLYWCVVLENDCFRDFCILYVDFCDRCWSQTQPRKCPFLRKFDI